jgi:hypothetical protein
MNMIAGGKIFYFPSPAIAALKKGHNTDLCKTALAKVVMSGLWPESAFGPDLSSHRLDTTRFA